MLRVSGKIVSSFWKKSPLTSSNFGHSNIVCTIVSEPWPQHSISLLIRPTFPGPFGVDNRTGPHPYPSTGLETLDFEARELLVDRDT